jgi:hypothetical protein
MRLYEKGDILIGTRHGTDSSYEEKFEIIEITDSMVMVFQINQIKNRKNPYFPRRTVDEIVAGEMQDWRIEYTRPLVELDEGLFTI